MNLKVEVPINATKEEIWKVITDIEGSQDRISGIETVEVHHDHGDRRDRDGPRRHAVVAGQP